MCFASWMVLMWDSRKCLFTVYSLDNMSEMYYVIADANKWGSCYDLDKITLDYMHACWIIKQD